MESEKNAIYYLWWYWILNKKIDGCANNLEKSSTTKIGEHIPCGYSMPTIWGFDHIENKRTLFRGKDCMNKFCTSLREHTKKYCWFWKEKNVIINKKRIKIISRCKIMLHLRKTDSKKSC